MTIVEGISITDITNRLCIEIAEEIKYSFNEKQTTSSLEEISRILRISNYSTVSLSYVGNAYLEAAKKSQEREGGVGEKTSERVNSSYQYYEASIEEASSKIGMLKIAWHFLRAIEFEGLMGMIGDHVRAKKTDFQIAVETSQLPADEYNQCHTMISRFCGDGPRVLRFYNDSALDEIHKNLPQGNYDNSS